MKTLKNFIKKLEQIDPQYNFNDYFYTIDLLIDIVDYTTQQKKQLVNNLLQLEKIGKKHIDQTQIKTNDATIEYTIFLSDYAIKKIAKSEGVY